MRRLRKGDQGCILPALQEQLVTLAPKNVKKASQTVHAYLDHFLMSHQSICL